MADNDPKHMSKEAKGVNYWRTTAESPDCNPIENLWHELKEYNRRVVKPTNKQQLIDGIRQFIFIIIIIIIIIQISNRYIHSYTNKQNILVK